MTASGGRSVLFENWVSGKKLVCWRSRSAPYALLITDFPATPRLDRCKPVYKKLPGWKSDIRGVRSYDELPENCKAYVNFIEEQCGAPIRIVSNGPKRNEVLYR